MDCGPTCLKMITQYYGKKYDIENLRNRCHITREGVSLLGISDAAESIGLRTKGVRLTWEQLRDETHLPCIVHWSQSHFVVVYNIAERCQRHNVFVADPAHGLLKYKENDFLKNWIEDSERHCGIALLLEPTPEFYSKK